MYNELLIELIEVLCNLDEYNDDSVCFDTIKKLLPCIKYNMVTDSDIDYLEFMRDKYNGNSRFTVSDDVYLCSVLEDASELLSDNNWRGDLQDSIKSVIYNFELEWSR